jgi:predicted metal-dependent hydrolase
MSYQRDTIVVRNMTWNNIPDSIDPLVIPGKPEESFFFIAVSALLPYLEPYLIRSISKACEYVDDSNLLANMKAFCEQEKHHFKSHISFNKAIGFTDIPEIKELQKRIAEDYKKMTSSKSLSFNIAYAETFEAFTLATAIYIIKTKQLDGVSQPVQDLFKWHFLEEIEHRFVAFDVCRELNIRYKDRIKVGLYTHKHLLQFCLSVVSVLLKEHKKTNKYSKVEAIKRVAPFAYSISTILLPKIVKTYMPWYNPRKVKVPELIELWKEEFENNNR